MSGSYNGWSGGYPTWCVALWLSNDEGLYNATGALLSETQDASRSRVADALKTWVRDELAPDLGRRPVGEDKTDGGRPPRSDRHVQGVESHLQFGLDLAAGVSEGGGLGQ